MTDQRKTNRKNLSYYLSVNEADTGKRAGVLVDISPEGFKLECTEASKIGQVRRFRVYLTNDMSTQTSMVFTGVSIWCRPDVIDPSSFHVGFKVINSTQSEARNFQRLCEEYGTQAKSDFNSFRYPWK